MASMEEPLNGLIQQYARDGLSKVGHHGVVDAMGVPGKDLPKWDDIQIITAQLHKMPLLDDDPVDTRTVIGPNAPEASASRYSALRVGHEFLAPCPSPPKSPWRAGAELSGTGICSGEGGMAARGAGSVFALFLTSWHPAGSAFPGTSSKRSRPSTSRAVRGPRPARADTCPATRSKGKSPWCAA